MELGLEISCKLQIQVWFNSNQKLLLLQVGTQISLNQIYFRPDPILLYIKIYVKSYIYIYIYSIYMWTDKNF